MTTRGTQRRAPIRQWITASGIAMVTALPLFCVQAETCITPWDQHHPAFAPFMVPTSPTCTAVSWPTRDVSPQAPVKTLVLYTNTGEWGYLGCLFAAHTCNLLSRFGQWKAIPANTYRKGQLKNFNALLYIGSTYDEPLAAGLAEDIGATKMPILWLNDNLHLLAAKLPDDARLKGWSHQGADNADISKVQYKNTTFERSAQNNPSMRIAISDPSKVRTLATSLLDQGGSRPWAIQTGNFFYIADMPVSFMSMNDRYLAFADILFEALAPNTRERHRALVRLEDVSPNTNPAHITAIADALFERKVPFSIGVIPRFEDPHGAFHQGKPTSFELQDRPEMVKALRYAITKGATLVMHGYTHQFKKLLNPYSSVTGADFEFYRTHVDPKTNDVIYDGPVPSDSKRDISLRLLAGKRIFAKLKLPLPTIFEFPHYAASVASYDSVRMLFKARYERGMYFSDALGKEPHKVTHKLGVNQCFPYPVTDIYGSFVIPENLGNVQPEAINNNKPRTPEDILYTASLTRAIRDSVASFFYHPFLGTTDLIKVVDGLKKAGWEFVSPNDIKD